MATFYKSNSIPEAIADSLVVPRPVDTLVLNGGKLYRSTSATVATYVLVANAGVNVTQMKVQITQAGWPAATTTGVIPFGTSIAANQVIVGLFLYLNVNTDVGASGITQVDLTIGAGGVNLIETFNMVASTGAPVYLAAADAESVDWPWAVTSAGQPAYTVDSTGADLDEVVAFDVTLVLLVSDTIIDVS